MFVSVCVMCSPVSLVCSCEINLPDNIEAIIAKAGSKRLWHISWTIISSFFLSSKPKKLG